MTPQEAEKQRFLSYRQVGGIKRCIEDLFGNNIQLSNQQEVAAYELSKLIAAKIKLAKGQSMTEEETLYSKKIGISIMSGMGSGKDFFSSIMILVFMVIFKDALCTCTANSAKQLKNVLWAEISRIMALSKRLNPDIPHHPKENPTIMEHMFEWQAERVNFRPMQGKSHFAEALTISPYASSDEQAKTLTGRHSKYMLMVIDEAAGVPEPVFENLEGTLTGTVNLILMIFNPIRSKGYAVRSQNEDRLKWVNLRWNCEETVFPDANMTRTIQARNEMMLEKYGKESNPYRIKVLGLPPLVDNNTLIPWDWIMDSIDREIAIDPHIPVLLGVDPAAGGDKSVIARRQGGKVYPFVRFNLSDTMEFTGRVIREAVNYEAESIMVDPIGVGKGVYDRLREQGYKAISVDVRRTPRNTDRFDKLRDELWWTLREQFEKGLISIPNDPDLIDQLGTVKSAVTTSSGKEKIMSKVDMRREMGQSPDEADALCLTYLYDDVQLMRKNKPVKYTPPIYNTEQSWMAA